VVEGLMEWEKYYWSWDESLLITKDDLELRRTYTLFADILHL